VRAGRATVTVRETSISRDRVKVWLLSYSNWSLAIPLWKQLVYSKDIIEVIVFPLGSGMPINLQGEHKQNVHLPHIINVPHASYPELAYM
jgi:hypothetical protein